MGVVLQYISGIIYDYIYHLYIIYGFKSIYLTPNTFLLGCCYRPQSTNIEYLYQMCLKERSQVMISAPRTNAVKKMSMFGAVSEWNKLL